MTLTEYCAAHFCGCCIRCGCGCLSQSTVQTAAANRPKTFGIKFPYLVWQLECTNRTATYQTAILDLHLLQNRVCNFETSSLYLAHTIRCRISIDGLRCLSQPDLPVSSFVSCLYNLLKLWPLHALVHKDAAQQCHVRPYGLQVLIGSVSQLRRKIVLVKTTQ